MNEANRSFSLTQKVKQNPAVGLLAILSFFGWLLVVFNINFTIWALIMAVNLNGVHLLTAPHAICKNHK